MTALEEAAVTLAAAQAAVITRALADAEQYRRDSAAAWCADCAAAQDGACPGHLAYLAPAAAYRELAAELAHVTKSAGRDVPPPRPASDLSRLGQERTMANTTTAASPPAARSRHEICEAARLVNCGECWQVPGKPCTPDPDGYHVARLGRAMRRGLLAGQDLIGVLQALVVFTNDTVVHDAPDGAQ